MLHSTWMTTFWLVGEVHPAVTAILLLDMPLIGLFFLSPKFTCFDCSVRMNLGPLIMLSFFIWHGSFVNIGLWGVTAGGKGFVSQFWFSFSLSRLLQYAWFLQHQDLTALAASSVPSSCGAGAYQPAALRNPVASSSIPSWFCMFFFFRVPKVNTPCEQLSSAPQRENFLQVLPAWHHKTSLSPSEHGCAHRSELQLWEANQEALSWMFHLSCFLLLILYFFSSLLLILTNSLLL